MLNTYREALEGKTEVEKRVNFGGIHSFTNSLTHSFILHHQTSFSVWALFKARLQPQGIVNSLQCFITFIIVIS